MSRKSFILSSLLAVLAFYYPKIALAQEGAKFETSYQVTYEVKESGAALVTQQTTLKNLTSEYYAPEYSQTIGSTAVDNFSAADEQGTMLVNITKDHDNNQTNISLKFNREMVGLNKTSSWTLTYTSLESAIKNGQVWEISIPRVKEEQGGTTIIAGYNLDLKVPLSFGEEIFIVPYSPKKVDAKTVTYSFNKDDLTQSGVSATFGDYQIFAFTLDYHLKNESLSKTTQEITLPPDIFGYQKIIFADISDPPQSVKTDLDGNYLASFQLKPRQTLNISLSGFVQLYSRYIDEKQGGQGKNIPINLVNLYIKEQPYWPINNEELLTLAKRLISPSNTVAQNAMEIYKYVTQNLKYNQQRAKTENLDRLGALEALKQPELAVCTEFTDLFITLARAAGIPAREIDGYAHTENRFSKPLSIRLSGGDVLHAWAQFYDPALGWVQIDPTWASTTNGLNYFNKLDTNHVALAIKGVSSEQPSPAGSFKTSEFEKNQDVRVGLAQSDQLPSEVLKPNIDFNPPKTIIAGLGRRSKIKVLNEGNVTIFNSKVATTLGDKSDKRELALEQTLPPYSNSELTLKLNHPWVWKSEDTLLQVILSYEGFDGKPYQETHEYTVKVIPFYLTGWFWLLSAFLGTFPYVMRHFGRGWLLFRWQQLAHLLPRPPGRDQ